MKKLLYLPALVVVFMLIIRFAGIPVFFQKVPVATHGIKQHLFGKGGVVQQVYPTGFHFCFKAVYRWHMIDSRTHVVHFTGSEQQNNTMSNISVRSSLPIRTKDNNTAYIDVSVLYKVVPESAFEIVNDGLMSSYKDRAISTIEGILRSQLASLTSEQYQITQERVELQGKIVPILNEQLARFHLTCERILIRRLGFPTEYEKKLQDKQLQRQLSRLEEALQRRAEEEKDTKGLEERIEALVQIKESEWNKELKGLEAENKVKIAEVVGKALNYVKKVEAEGDRAYIEAKAEADLLLQKEKAYRIEGVTAALNGPGGDIYNVMKAIKGLNFSEIILNSNKENAVNPLDIKKLLDLLMPAEVK